MENLDTAEYALSKVGEAYVRLEIYSDQELTTKEIPQVLGYFSQFEGRVPVLVDRHGRYALSTGVQLAIIEHAKSLFSALGIIDHTPLQRRITQIASITYLKDLPVKSFSDIAQAETWLKRYGPLPKFHPKTGLSSKSD
jgi:hypothetical protein